MEIRMIVAMIRRDRLEEVEKALQAIGVERINVTKAKGYGEYQDFFARSWMVEEVRIEVYTRAEEVERIAKAIMDAAHTGLPGDGVLAVMPVERFYLVRTRAEATPEDFWPRRAG